MNDSVDMGYSGEPFISNVAYGASPPPGKPATSIFAPVSPPEDSG